MSNRRTLWARLRRRYLRATGYNLTPPDSRSPRVVADLYRQLSQHFDLLFERRKEALSGENLVSAVMATADAHSLYEQINLLDGRADSQEIAEKCREIDCLLELSVSYLTSQRSDEYERKYPRPETFYDPDRGLEPWPTRELDRGGPP